MIVVDTSALLEIALEQSEADYCAAVLRKSEMTLISAGTVAEAMVVARRRLVGPEVQRLIVDLSMNVVPVTFEEAVRVADAYDRWGKGVHRAHLNLGDCFAYALAAARECPLLFVGNDFARTDIARAEA